MPELISNFMPAGMSIEMTEPTMMDSWLQFFKNTPQMGLFVLVLVFGEVCPGELQRGTLVPVLTKGVAKKTVSVREVYCSSSETGRPSTPCDFCVSWLYSVYFWDMDVQIGRLMMAVGMVWLLASCCLRMKLLLGGILFSGGWGACCLPGFCSTPVCGGDHPGGESESANTAGV